MQRSKVGIFIDNTVITLALILVLVTFFRQFIKSFVISLIFATILSLVFIYTLIWSQNRRYQKLSIEKSEVKNIEEFNFELRKMSGDERIEFFKKMFTSSGVEIIDKTTLLVDKKTLIILRLDKDELAESDVFSAYSSSLGEAETIIVCNSARENLYKLAERLKKKILFFTPIETYALMKKYNTFPTAEAGDRVETAHKLKLNKPFLKSRARILLRIGFLLYILAAFVPFTKYYIISASITLTLGIITLLFGQKELTPDKSSTSILLS